MRASSSEASGSSISSRRGLASSARPMATRCFSPPDSRPGPPLQQASDAEQIDDALEIVAALGLAARTSVRRAGSGARSDAGTAALPGTRSRSGAGARGTNTPRAVSTSTRRRRHAALSGRISPAMTLTIDVLPEPDRPNSATSPPPVSNRASSRKLPEPVPDIDGQRHSISRRRLALRAISSEASSASMEIATETSVRRKAPASPPGTCVKV